MAQKQLFDNLATALATMREMGFDGLDLPQNPFEPLQASGEAPSAAPALKVAQAADPERVPMAQPKAERAKPNKPKMVANKAPKLDVANLMDIMDMVTPKSGIEENRIKAEAIEGSTKVEALRNLYQAFSACQACALGTTRKNFVYGEGSPEADLMFVGEGPGRDEDLSGRPFVGKAGQLLNRIIEAMGLQRADVFIANVVKCRPPGNRTPLPDEMASCSPILKKQVQIIDPKLIVVLGATALRFFKGPDAGITRNRGKFFEWEGYRVMPTFHPAYVLRNPAAKREVWTDIKQVMADLGMKKD